MRYSVTDPLTGKPIEIELSADQQDAFDQISAGRFQFYRISGPAGCGKSCLISVVKKELGAEITATTARAALNVNGTTVDQLFGFSRETWSIKNKSWVAKIMSTKSQIIVIDEASMIGSNMSQIIYEIARAYGKTIILVGDWAQAQPVKEDWPSNTPMFLEAQSFKLSTNHRQDRGPYLDALNMVRMGKADDPFVGEVFEQCVSEVPDDDRFVRLYALNRAADKYNSERFNALHVQQGIAKFTTKATFFDVRKTKPFEYGDSFKSKAMEDCNLSHMEDYCIGTRVILTANCYGDGFINSDTGVITDIVGDAPQEDEDGFMTISPPQSFAVKLDRNGATVIVHEIDREFKGAMADTQYMVRGFPIRYGWAMTIHRAQGMTVDRAYLDMSSLKYMPSLHGLAYVGLSRTRKIEGLSINAWMPQYVHSDKAIAHLI